MSKNWPQFMQKVISYSADGIRSDEKIQIRVLILTKWSSTKGNIS